MEKGGGEAASGFGCGRGNVLDELCVWWEGDG